MKKDQHIEIMETLLEAQDQIKYLRGKLSTKWQSFTEPTTQETLRRLDEACGIVFSSLK